MKVLYLVQTASSRPYPDIPDDKLCLLTFKQPADNAIFLPNSTWTTGRNALLQAVLDKAAKGEVYDYYIFLDDDLIWTSGSFQEFEDRLEASKPLIAFPHMRGYAYTPVTFMYDACFNAFHKDVIFKTDLLPYVADFDHISWWYSQFIVIYKTLYMFSSSEIGSYGDLIVDNSAHNPYPRAHNPFDFIPYLEQQVNLSKRYRNWQLPNLGYETIIRRVQSPPTVKSKNAVVITTIFQPTPQIHKIIEWCRKKSDDRQSWQLIIVADKKTPAEAYVNLDCIYLGLELQEQLFPDFNALLPFNHYCRKNLGYLYAIKNGYSQILDTDDDNLLYDMNYRFDQLEEVTVANNSNDSNFSNWLNIFKQYTDANIWPRGLPFNSKNNLPVLTGRLIAQDRIAVWQGVVDGEPDVDAVYRLARSSEVAFNFNDGKPVAIQPAILCPFNSQNTLWKDCFKFMYLPATASFRYCDILRSYIANFGFWSEGKQLAYTPATAVQDRNAHDIVADLVSETPMYQTCRLVEQIGQQLLAEVKSAEANSAESASSSYQVELMLEFYKRLQAAKVISELDVKLVEMWLSLINDDSNNNNSNNSNN